MYVHHCDAIVVYIYVHCQFLWFPNIGMPSYVLNRFIVSSFDFQSLGSHPKLYLWLFICSFDFSSLRPHPSSIYALCNFLRFPIIEKLSQVLYMLICLFLSFLIISTDARLYLCSFLPPKVTHHQDAILVSILKLVSLLLLVLITETPSYVLSTFI